MKKIVSFNVRLGWRNQMANVYEYRMQVDNKKTLIYYMIQNDYYFERDSLYGYNDDGERFMFFSKAVLELLPQINFAPEVIHCNDWQTALVPVYLKTTNWKEEFYKNIIYCFYFFD